MRSIQVAPFLRYRYLVFGKMNMIADLHTQPAVLEFVLLLTGEGAQNWSCPGLLCICDR